MLSKQKLVHFFVFSWIHSSNAEYIQSAHMAVKYPNLLNLRLTNEDMRQLEEISEKLDTPRSTLIRRAWREWLVSQSMEKPQPQMANPPAA
jgi:hypothetical protein